MTARGETSSAMTITQQSGDPLWHLTPGTALRLPIGPGARRLEVVEGRLWLTAEGEPGAVPADIWLEPGQGIDLPAGVTIVADAHPRASFRLVVPPAACARASARAGRGAGLSVWWAEGLSRSLGRRPHLTAPLAA